MTAHRMNMIKTPWHVIVVALGLLLTRAQTGLGQSAEAQLTNFFKQYLEETFRLRPMDATRLGDHRFDHLLDDLTPAARAGWTQQTRRALEELPNRVDYQKLSRAAQIDFEIFRQELIK